jgi:hypothetical protein
MQKTSTVSTVFGAGVQTVETVRWLAPPPTTPLKRGVNENEIGQVASRF